MILQIYLGQALMGKRSETTIYRSLPITKLSFTVHKKYPPDISETDAFKSERFCEKYNQSIAFHRI